MEINVARREPSEQNFFHMIFYAIKKKGDGLNDETNSARGSTISAREDAFVT